VHAVALATAINDIIITPGNWVEDENTLGLKSERLSVF